MIIKKRYIFGIAVLVLSLLSLLLWSIASEFLSEMQSKQEGARQKVWRSNRAYRINFLQDVLQGLPKNKYSQLYSFLCESISTLQHSEYQSADNVKPLPDWDITNLLLKYHIQDKTEFRKWLHLLGFIEYRFSKYIDLNQLREEVSAEFVRAKMRASFSDKLHPADDIVTIEEIPGLPISAKVNHKMQIQWHEGGDVICCFLKVDSNFLDELIDSIVEHYRKTTASPLKFDIIYPYCEGSLTKGWEDGGENIKFWSQSWVSNEGVKVVNICYYDSQNCKLVIMSPRKQRTKELMQLYQSIRQRLVKGVDRIDDYPIIDLRE